MQAILASANMSMKFWPCAFCHAFWLHNAIPHCNDPTVLPMTKATGLVQDFSHLRTFGCQAWARPPGERQSKFKPNSKRDTFLVRVPHATHNILWCDPETSKVKIATHTQFNEGFNDLSVDEIPPNVVHSHKELMTVIAFLLTLPTLQSPC